MSKKAQRRARKTNPIIVAAKSGVRDHCLFLLGTWDEQTREDQRDIVKRFFTEEAIYEMGSLIAGALIAGDKQMAGTVRAAIKEAGRMFGRNLEKALLDKAVRYMLCNWYSLLDKHSGYIVRAVDEFKKNFERDCNNGEEIAQYRWSRLRRLLRLPKRSCVRHDRKPVKFPEVELIDFAPRPVENPRRRRRSTERRKTVS
jgi:hypothetical protein